jgi:hypothetical protein
MELKMGKGQSESYLLDHSKGNYFADGGAVA